MTEQRGVCEQLAVYATRAQWDALSQPARDRLKQHLLDAVGCALGAVQASVIRAVRGEQDEFAPSGPCSMIGGGHATPERAVFLNGALVRYLDFMDTFIAPGEACHPSDNLAPVLAAAEYADASGRDLLTALAVAYHVQCRLTGSGVPIMRAGFDHTVQLAISTAAGMSRALGLAPEIASHAIALCAAGGLGLAGTRTGQHVAQWKGLASAATSFQCMHNVRLAQREITGPLHIFEGPLGLETVLKQPFGIDWNRETYDAILQCCLKRFDAEQHAQPCIEGILELRAEHNIRAADVSRVHVDIFDAGFEMIGGGKYLDPASVRSKEDADHSLFYLMAVALLDGEVLPKQFEPDRISRPDVQELLHKVSAAPSDAYSADYPRSMCCRISVELSDGRQFEKEKSDYLGFSGRPAPWEDTVGKFMLLGRSAASETGLQQILDVVADIENRTARDLATALRALPDRAGAEGT